MNSLSCFITSLQKNKPKQKLLFHSCPVFYECRLWIKPANVRLVRKGHANYISMLSYRCKLHSYVVTNQSSGLVTGLLGRTHKEWCIVGKELDRGGKAEWSCGVSLGKRHGRSHWWVAAVTGKLPQGMSIPRYRSCWTCPAPGHEERTDQFSWAQHQPVAGQPHPRQPFRWLLHCSHSCYNLIPHSSLALPLAI